MSLFPNFDSAPVYGGMCGCHQRGGNVLDDLRALPRNLGFGLPPSTARQPMRLLPWEPTVGMGEIGGAVSPAWYYGIQSNQAAPMVYATAFDQRNPYSVNQAAVRNAVINESGPTFMYAMTDGVRRS
jgi:hypothetical protein